MADSHNSTQPLEHAWLLLGKSLAVATGALIALFSLLFHVPVWVASLRGGLAFLGVWIIVRVAGAVLHRAPAVRPTHTGQPLHGGHGGHSGHETKAGARKQPGS